MSAPQAPPIPSSPHIEQAASRLFHKAWMSRIKWASGVRFDALVFPLDVPAEDESQTYRVTIHRETGETHCTCTAGQMGTPTCKHREVARAWLGLRAIS